MDFSFIIKNKRAPGSTQRAEKHQASIRHLEIKKVRLGGKPILTEAGYFEAVVQCSNGEIHANTMRSRKYQ